MMDQTADPDRADTERRTLGADKNYDTAEFVADCRARNITPHVAQNTRRSGGRAIDGRTSRHAGYEISQTKRQMAARIHASRCLVLDRRPHVALCYNFRFLQRHPASFTFFLR